MDDELGRPVRHRGFRRPESQAALARLDLGSVLIPMPEAGQVQVELTETGVPSAVWVVTPNGRFTIAAYAAPKSDGAVAGSGHRTGRFAAQGFRRRQHRGRPVGTRSRRTGSQGVVRFIGVDGYRWMIRCVVNGAPETIDALTVEARNALVDTVVRRGETPLPVRTPLAVQLPEPMAAQLRAAAEQAAAAAAQQAAEQQPPSQPVARRSAQGSAMQQLRTITGG